RRVLFRSRVAAPFDIGMCQLVHDDDFRMQVDNRLRIHLLKFLAFVEEFPQRHEGKPSQEGFRLRPSVRLDIPDAYVYAGIEQLVCLLKHPVGLPYPGAHSYIYFEFAAVRPPDKVQETLYTVLFVHANLHPEGYSAHKVNIFQGRIPTERSEKSQLKRT